MGASEASTTGKLRHNAMLTATLIHLRSKGDEMRRRLEKQGVVQLELDFTPTVDDLWEWKFGR